MIPEESDNDKTDRPIELVTIKDEPVDPEEGCFTSAARYTGDDGSCNERRLREGPYAAVMSQRQYDSSDPARSVYDNLNTNNVQNTGRRSTSTAQSNTQTNEHTNSQTNPQTNSLTNSQTNSLTNSQTNSQTVFKSYSLANIPKFGENGRVLTLGQRLALIKKKQEEEENEEGRGVPAPRLSSVTSTEGEATTSSSTFDVGERADSSSDHVTSQSDHVTTVQDRLGTYSGLNYQIAMKVLVPEEVNQVMSRRGKEFYTQSGLRILRFTRNHYPVYNECQVYVKGDPKQVLECLVLIADDLRKHCEPRRNRKTREEMMFLVLPTMISADLLRHRKGKRVVRHIEENNGVWIQIEDSVVQGECVINLTGHLQQMRNGLRQLLEEIVTSSHAETLPSLFYYIPSPRHRTHQNTYQNTCGQDTGISDGFSDGRLVVSNSGIPAWLPCDRQEFHRWNTHGDYRF